MLLLLLLLLLLLPCHRCVSFQPNIVLIVAEDLQLSSFDFPLPLPHIDALGQKYNWAYATSPNCSPSRSSLLTGLFPHQNQHFGLASAWKLAPRIATLPQLLKEHGYATGATYKLHVADEQHIFPFIDEFVGWEKCAATDYVQLAQRLESFARQHRATQRPFFWMHNLFDSHRSTGGTFLDRKGHAALRQSVGGGRRDDERDAAALKHNVSVPRFLGRDFRAAGLTADVRGYFRAVRRVDEAVGRVLAALRAADALESSLVVFTADHGPAFARGKLSLYDTGIRVPLVVRWPAGWHSRTDSNDLVSHVDLFETLRTVAGIAPAPATTPERHHTGRTLASVEQRAFKRTAVFSEFFAHGVECCNPSYAMISDRPRFKLIYHPLALLSHVYDVGCRRAAAPDGFGRFTAHLPSPAQPFASQLHDTLLQPPQWQLYDLVADPTESRNLAAQREHAPLLATMQTTLRRWLNHTADPVGTHEQKRAFMQLVEEPSGAERPRCGRAAL